MFSRLQERFVESRKCCKNILIKMDVIVQKDLVCGKQLWKSSDYIEFVFGKCYLEHVL